jgi:hypothetical protein
MAPACPPMALSLSRVILVCLFGAGVTPSRLQLGEVGWPMYPDFCLFSHFPVFFLCVLFFYFYNHSLFIIYFLVNICKQIFMRWTKQ